MLSLVRTTPRVCCYPLRATRTVALWPHALSLTRTAEPRVPIKCGVTHDVRRGRRLTAVLYLFTVSFQHRHGVCFRRSHNVRHNALVLPVYRACSPPLQSVTCSYNNSSAGLSDVGLLFVCRYIVATWWCGVCRPRFGIRANPSLRKAVPLASETDSAFAMNCGTAKAWCLLDPVSAHHLWVTSSETVNEKARLQAFVFFLLWATKGSYRAFNTFLQCRRCTMRKTLQTTSNILWTTTVYALHCPLAP